MFHFAGVLFRDIEAYSQYVMEKRCKKIMPSPNLRGHFFSPFGKGNTAVPFMFQKALIFKGFDGGKHRWLGYAKTGSNIRYPNFAIIGEKTDHLKIIFKRLSHDLNLGDFCGFVKRKTGENLRESYSKLTGSTSISR